MAPGRRRVMVGLVCASSGAPMTLTIGGSLLLAEGPMPDGTIGQRPVHGYLGLALLVASLACLLLTILLAFALRRPMPVQSQVWLVKLASLPPLGLSLGLGLAGLMRVADDGLEGLLLTLIGGAIGVGGLKLLGTTRRHFCSVGHEPQ